MDAEYFRFIYDYIYWARDRILNAVDGISEEEYARENGFVYKSIRGILAHALSGESVWLPRVRDEQGSLTSEDEVATRALLRSRWAAEEATQRAYLATLTDAEVAADVVFTGRDGNERRIPRWQILTLVFHHTVQHRSEAAEALSMIGHSPGDMDLLVYTRERGS